MRTAPVALLSVLASLAGCRRHSPTPAADASASAGDKTPEFPMPAAPPPQCTVEPVRWLVHPRGDGGTAGLGLEGGVLARGAQGPWVAWLDRTAATVVLAPPSGAPLRAPVAGGEETDAPVLAALGDVAVGVHVAQLGARRTHHVFVARAGAEPVELFAQPEPPDDALSIAATATSAGLLVAWDEDRADGSGAVVRQFVPREAVTAARPIPQPAPLALSPPELDASDPELVPMPDGGAVVLWLAAQDVDATVGNQTTADVYARALDPRGAPAGPPMRVTFTPGSRFGVVALPHAGALWVAYRVAGDSDQESGGDGGSVALVRLGADLRPTSSAVYLSDEDAMPSGEPVVLPDGAGVAVFWAERRGEGVVTVRRAVEPNGTLLRGTQDEPALAGELPADGTAAEPVLLTHEPEGALGLERAHCPPIAAAPPPGARDGG